MITLHYIIIVPFSENFATVIHNLTRNYKPVWNRVIAGKPRGEGKLLKLYFENTSCESMVEAWKPYCGNMIDRAVDADGQKHMSDAVVVLFDSTAGGTYCGSISESGTIEVSPEEAAALLRGFFDQSELQTNGLKVGGTKYTYLRHDDGLLLGKLKEGGCSVAKTKQTVLVGICGSGCQLGTVNKAVYQIREWLLKSGC